MGDLSVGILVSNPLSPHYRSLGAQGPEARCDSNLGYQDIPLPVPEARWGPVWIGEY